MKKVILLILSGFFCFASAAEVDLAALVADLGAADFKQRIAAEKQLRALSNDAIPALELMMKTDDVEVRNRLLNIVEYIVDHGPEGMKTFQEVIYAAETTSAERLEAIQQVCKKLGEGQAGALELLSQVAGGPTLSFPEPKAGLVRGQVASSMQRGFLALGNRAAHDVTTEATLVEALEVAVLRHYALRALGSAATQGGELALAALVEPSNYGLTLSATVTYLRPAITAGNAAVYEGLLKATENASDNDLFQIAIALQSVGVKNGALTLPIIEQILEKSLNPTPSSRALQVLEALVQQQHPPAGAKELLAKWGPKVEGMSPNGIRARAQATIRVAP